MVCIFTINVDDRRPINLHIKHPCPLGLPEMSRGPKDHNNARILQQIASRIPFCWALEQESRILVFVRFFGRRMSTVAQMVSWICHVGSAWVPSLGDTAVVMMIRRLQRMVTFLCWRVDGYPVLDPAAPSTVSVQEETEPMFTNFPLPCSGSLGRNGAAADFKTTPSWVSALSAIPLAESVCTTEVPGVTRP